MPAVGPVRICRDAGGMCGMWFSNRRMRGAPGWLLVCLGNPGPKYAKTRHNVGFRVADALARQQSARLDHLKFKALTGTVSLGEEKVLVLKPQTYMNLSGESVREASGYFKIPAEKILVVFDDISLPPGKLRIRKNGSAGGHNGVKSIISCLGSDQFPRVKIGVGAPPNPEYDLADWVLGTFSQQEGKAVDSAVENAVQAVSEIVKNGPDAAMNRYNGL